MGTKHPDHKYKTGKPIIQYDLEGNFIREWDCITDARKHYKGNIDSVLSKVTNTSCGFIWRYKNDPLPLDYKFPNHKSCKKVNQLSLEGEFIKKWNSLTEIQNELGYPNSNISCCCIKKQKTAYGYRWEYEKTNDDF